MNTYVFRIATTTKIESLVPPLYIYLSAINFALGVCDCALFIITFLMNSVTFSQNPIAHCLYASRQLHLSIGRLNLCFSKPHELVKASQVYSCLQSLL